MWNRKIGRGERARSYRMQGLLTGPVDYWVDELTRLAVEVGMDIFIYWTADDRLRQIELFAAEVVPAVQQQVAKARGIS